ncbi:hypothetical protein [Novipirellula artificiosorum]|uniref:Uncharacterized protein n=1 Tax=Novipirellula artificiosorum TaxID=2528016 RepID=A0A5C6DBK4_9BACT|nr:hypothetical protein [Novipirellula artificiosorum]TWU33224.1 hypothetical protein Poly41_49760 [Novipirellula artificiosorum]
MPTYVYDKRVHHLRSELVKPRGPSIGMPAAFTVDTGTGDSIAIPMEWLPDRCFVVVTTPDCKIDVPFSYVVSISTTKAPPSKAKIAAEVVKKVVKGARKGNPIGGAIEGLMVSDEIGDASVYSEIKRGKTESGTAVTFFIKR